MKIYDIPNYEGKYGVTVDGKIWSYPRKYVSKNGRYLKQSFGSNGYLLVSLSAIKKRTCLVHRLIALAIIPNPQNKPCVNHLNGNKCDNRVENLAWCTYSENEHHSYDVLNKKANKTNLGNFGIKSQKAKPIIMKNKNGMLINIFGSASEVERETNRFHLQTCVSACARGKQEYSKGYKWEYITREEYYNIISLFNRIGIF